MSASEQRPNPDELLHKIKASEKSNTGKLKIFLGYSAGVGKTYAMLDDAKEQLKSGIDVMVGYVEPHTRPETLRLLEGLPVIEPQTIQYKNMTLKEFDLEAALLRKPHLILVDELAHSNAYGVRNKKRYQDVEELLNAGIDVFTTVNVQHIESLNDIIENITKIPVRETIPDYMFDHADKVMLVDVDPEELLSRFKEGKIYRPERAVTAMQNFFTLDNLRLLREIALRKTTDIISQENLSELSTSDKKINTRFLVCVGPSPSSAKCIRWTARTADAFHAPWTALYVETPKSSNFSDAYVKNIRDNLDLAARLGGQQITLNEYDVAATIAEYAKLLSITNIVVGKSRNKRTLRTYFKPNFEDILITLLPSTEIHIISDNDAAKNQKMADLRDIKRNLVFSWTDTAKMLLIWISATIISLGLRSFGIGEQNVIMVYILSVLIISRITSGFIYGVTASLLSVLTFNFLFVEPYFTFDASQPGYPLTFLIMLVVAIITSTMMIRIKTQAGFAVAKERKTELLYEINKKLLVTRGLENIIELTNQYIMTICSRSVIFYSEDPILGKPGTYQPFASDADASFMLNADEQAVAHWVFVNKKRAGAGTDTLMGAGAFYMPILSQGNVLGVIGISCINSTTINHEMRSFLRMIASLVAMALERQALSDEQRKIVVESEKEATRSNLLRAISHDLRTPLTAILGASSAVLENKNMDGQTKDKLIAGVKDNAQWLIRMVENLLFVTRINDAALKINKTPEAVEEVVAEAVSRVRNQFPSAAIQVKVPDELMLVPMDATLIEQVIINLLENAIKHSSSVLPIEVQVSLDETDAIFEIRDSGEGIPEDELPYLFEGYITNKKKSPDSSRGMGIGLSICKSIMNAHNGKIEVENRPEGGALFRFMLPLNGGFQHEE
ncbi:MAG: sensor histidine kinase KdpD [Erysipelotrichaceae bacterium]